VPHQHRVELDTFGGNTTGIWIRCSDYLCDPSYPDTVIQRGYASGTSYASIMEIEPSDVAVYIDGIRLVQV
jgi:hypothetical protein